MMVCAQVANSLVEGVEVDVTLSAGTATGTYIYMSRYLTYIATSHTPLSVQVKKLNLYSLQIIAAIIIIQFIYVCLSV